MTESRWRRMALALGTLLVVCGCQSKSAVVKLGGETSAVKAVGSGTGNKAVVQIATGAFRNAEFHRDGLYSTKNGEAPLFRSMSKARTYKKKPSLNRSRSVKKMSVDMQADAKMKANMRRRHDISPIWLRTHNNAKTKRRGADKSLFNLTPLYMDNF